MGARRRACSSTSCMSWPTRVSSPVRSTPTSIRADTFRVPACARSPGPASTGVDSPVSSAGPGPSGPRRCGHPPARGRRRAPPRDRRAAAPRSGPRARPSRRCAGPRSARAWRGARVASAAARCLAPQQVASGEEQEDQHRDRVEVHLAAAAHGGHRPVGRARGEADADRQVHVQRAPSERAPGAGEEDPAAPHERGDGQAEAQPAEEARELRLHAVEDAAVEREGDGHDVGRHRARHADAGEHPALLAPARALLGQAPGGMRRVAERVERAGDRRQRDHARVPHDPCPAPPEVQARLHDAGNERAQPLDQPDARRAVDALQVELGAREPRRVGAADAGLDAGVVHLVVAAPGRPRGGGRRPVPQDVVALEAVVVQERVDGQAPVAAEARVGARAAPARRHRKPAVLAVRAGGRGRLSGDHGRSRSGS